MGSAHLGKQNQITTGFISVVSKNFKDHQSFTKEMMANISPLQFFGKLWV
jgi:hypothetical protein